jgi:DNA-binding transcriptional ArsR family regulator/uncharacterized protein YndB with AHSA1/START domain
LTRKNVSGNLPFVAAYRVDAVAVLADPTRRAIVERLAIGPIAVGEIARDLPVSRPAVSQHLRVLEDAGLVIVRPVGTRRLYQLDPAGVEAIRDYFEQLWQQSLAAFKASAEAQENASMVNQVITAPVARSVRVEVPVERAFAIFTAGFGGWWPPEFHIGGQPFTDVIVEPRNGGRWFERDASGGECDWGHVLSWDPPRRVVLAWHIGPDWQFNPDPARASEVEVRFIPDGEGATRVELEHRGFERHGEGGGAVRDGVGGDGGWTHCLDRFVAATRA